MTHVVMFNDQNCSNVVFINLSKTVELMYISNFHSFKGALVNGNVGVLQ